MFVRIKTTPNSPKKAVQIVESLRDGNKIKQRIVRHVGTALNDDELKRMQELAEHIKASMEQGSQPGLFPAEEIAEIAIQARNRQTDESLPVDLKKLREQQRVIVGIHEVYGRVYHEIGFDKVISNPKRKPAAVKNLFHVVMGRIANPKSKMATVMDLSENFGVELSLPSVYRMMDQIDEKVISNIQQRAYRTACGLFKRKIHVVFYDCTTLYFESFTEDELKENGYSKDMKFNQPQVLLALLVTEHGLPIGYEVFPGSQYEGHTLEKAVKKIEDDYRISDIVFVADSALLSDDNLKLLERLGKRYIVGARLKSMSKKYQEKIIDKTDYRILTKPDDENEYSIKEMLVNNRRLIVSYNEKNAKKDAHDREKSIERLISKLRKKNTNPAKLISNFGYKKFLQVKGNATVEINQEKIEREKLWDGIHGIITNHPDLTPEQIIRQYHGLWQVEQCFRLSKHDLKIRPVFHWTPPRIKAHIAICFMALTCTRYLHYRIKTQHTTLSEQQIRQKLLSAQISILKHQQSRILYGVPSSINPDVKKIYHLMGMKISDVPFRIN
ncbi:MAG: Transposase DDE domain protein [Bacteroidetes bacterium ADurb.Bin408]|nr:MAG: Transposase DDE domain protein [Bacteroidetes bacterium ADurb.Bin408]